MAASYNVPQLRPFVETPDEPLWFVLRCRFADQLPELISICVLVEVVDIQNTYRTQIDGASVVARSSEDELDVTQSQ